jgi:NADPH-dependent 2,4-dienoyl-CoA reductase/sulfur reductase-like enzyme/rhodanese-related sulfurtransferase
MPSSKPKRILVIGGVAGGASCATRARRLCERCEIVIFDRGPYVSFANCGLPYFVGNVIQAEEKLLVATPELFRDRFNISVQLETEVTEIIPERRVILTRHIKTGEVREEPYDALVISTGAEPVRPPLPGIDLPGIYVLRTIPDSQKIRAAVEHAGHALVVGGGMIGLEMAENLVQRGLKVTLVELGSHVLPVLDPEMAVYAEDRLRQQGVQLLLGQAVQSFDRPSGERLKVTLSNGAILETDLVILGIGVKPNSDLAKQAGLRLSPRQAVCVDAFMQTSDSHIWAVGDVVASDDVVTDAKKPIPLAGPANRQGRIAAGAILESFADDACPSPRAMKFRGVQGTAVCGVFGMTIASTGASERSLIKNGITDYEKIYLHPGNHASYFPDAKPIHLKLLFAGKDGRIFGAQAVGEADVARRIDVIAMALQLGGTVFDLEEAELCYAPQYGAAKDPVNMCGMIAGNLLRGDLRLADWSQLNSTDAMIVDVRSPSEYESGHIDRAVNIPLENLRERVTELPRDRECWLVCGVGQRAYYGLRILLQHGIEARILSGGMRTFQTMTDILNP